MSRAHNYFWFTALVGRQPVLLGYPKTSGAIILAFLGLFSLSFADDLSKADRRFYFNAKPIHPLLIKKFEPWVSDARPPIITELNLTAAWDSNEFAANFKTDADGTVSIGLPEGGSFSYRPLGTLPNGVHILRTFSSGGGTAVFEAILFLRIQTRSSYLADGSKRGEQVFLQVLRRFPLGDRDDAQVIIEKDRVIVGKSRYRTEPVELKLDQDSAARAASSDSVSEKNQVKGQPK